MIFGEPADADFGEGDFWSKGVSMGVGKKLVLNKNAGDRLNQKNVSRRIKIYPKSFFSN